VTSDHVSFCFNSLSLTLEIFTVVGLLEKVRGNCDHHSHYRSFHVKMNSDVNSTTVAITTQPGRSYYDFSVWPYDLEHCATWYYCARLRDNCHQVWTSTIYPCL